ncbi:hypothetical protein HSB1_09780 [Halogranum salarium B-1]|uniref:Uncharacterized protein n=1 Tax=Halogranum salarium B-1 TaxID=1210908 RepID=J2ZI39_9EURY|nr:hypothetical protein HSB1_09780 [Halogranum salarium B-1]
MGPLLSVSSLRTWLSLSNRTTGLCAIRRVLLSTSRCRTSGYQSWYRPP